MRPTTALLLFLISCGQAESEDMSTPAVLDPSRPRRHCDMSKDPLNLPDQVCRERVDVPRYFDRDCQASNGIARPGECPREGAIMGCIHADGLQLDWWYTGVKQYPSRVCFLAGGTLINP